jgi:calcineurin-like phosphoesterase family protein
VFLVLDHYPMAGWNRAFHGAVHLHGHVHGRFDNSDLRRFDVGIDSIGVEPIRESVLIDRALKIDPPKYKESD